MRKFKLASLAFELAEAKTGRIQLLPYGEFRATDGRPNDVPHWIVADSNGQDVVNLANNQRNPLPIDYEHQILHSKANGKEAPSAGWMEYLYFTPQGIFADVRWTDKAADYIKNGEYRYISAVFAYDNEGYVRKIFHAALTNSPALDGMDEAMVAASQHFDLVDVDEVTQSMDKETLAALSAILGKQISNDEQAKNEILTAAAEKKVIALSSEIGVQAVDPTQYVPVEQVVALQTDLNQLKAEREADKKAQLITAALSNGKLTPALKDWAEGLSVEALSAYLEKVPAVASLSGEMQAKADPNANKVVALSAEEEKAARALGMTQEEFIKIHKGGE